MNDYLNKKYDEILNENSSYANHITADLQASLNYIVNLHHDYEVKYTNFISTLITSVLASGIYAHYSKIEIAGLNWYLLFTSMSFTTIIFTRLFEVYSLFSYAKQLEINHQEFKKNQKTLNDVYSFKPTLRIHKARNILSYIAHACFFIPMLALIMSSFKIAYTCALFASIVIVISATLGIFYLENKLGLHHD